MKMLKKPLKDTSAQSLVGRAATFFIASPAEIFKRSGNWAQAELDKAAASEAVK
jgi:hypothetical protein